MPTAPTLKDTAIYTVFIILLNIQQFFIIIDILWNVLQADPSLFHVGPLPRIGSPPAGPSALPSTQRHKGSSSSEKDSVGSKESAPSKTSSKAQRDGVDVTRATFLDVAVVRCLFIPNWQEEGIYWALHYLYNRFCNKTSTYFVLF